MSISNKVRLVFLAMITVTLIICGSAYIGNNYIIDYVNRASVLKDFQISLERLKSIQLVFEFSEPGTEPPADAFSEAIGRAQALNRRIMADQGSLTEDIAFRFGGVADKLENYRRVSLEAADRRASADRLSGKSLAVLADLRRDLTAIRPDLKLAYLERINTAWFWCTEMRRSPEPSILSRLKDAGRKLDEIRRDSGLDEVMTVFTTDIEAYYLNYLALRNKEKFLTKTADDLFLVSQESINNLKAWNLESQRMLIWVFALISLAAIGVNVFLWRRTRNYFTRFLSAQTEAISAVRRGDYTFKLARQSDDELGDLTAAINETARSLAESENKYQSMIESLNDPVYICSAAGEIEYINPALRNMVGRDVTGELCYQALHGLDRECPWCRKGADQGPLPNTDPISSPKLKRRFNISQSLLTRKDGSVSTLAVLNDITEKTRMESQLRQAQKMEALGGLAGGIAHDFNNILGAVTGYAELALEDSASGKVSPKDLMQIIKAADRAKNLIQKILAFSRKADIRLEPLEINRVIDDTVSIIERTIPRMISIRSDLAPDLPLVNGDPIQMEQVLLNLAGNASDAMPQGGELLIETEAVTLDEEYADDHLGLSPGDYVQLTVSDTGCGMEKAVIDHIFEPFYTTKEVGKGTGLGLASVYGIVKSHQGYIMCYSEPSRGTSFKIYLPVLASKERPKEQTAVVGPALDGRGEGVVLLVDDEEPLRRIGARLLEGNGYRVLTARDGEEALSIYHERQREIDLVILDVNMPGMGGRKCLKIMRELNPEAKIIIASGYSAGGLLNDMRECDISGYLTKPFKRDNLLQLVRTAIKVESD